MEIVDIVILIILVFGAFRGFQKGLLLEIIGLIAFFAGIIGAFKLMDVGVSFLEQFMDKGHSFLPFFSFIIIFVLIVLLLNLVGMILKKTIDLTILGSFDDLAGSLAGVIKWALALSFLIWMLGYFHITLGEEQTNGSLLYPFIASLAPWLIDTLSVLMPFIKDFFDSVKQEVSPPSRQALML